MAAPNLNYKSQPQKYKRRKEVTPLYMRFTNLTIPIRAAAIIHIANARKCSQKEAVKMLQSELRSLYILNYDSIVSSACANGFIETNKEPIDPTAADLPIPE